MPKVFKAKTNISLTQILSNNFTQNACKTTSEKVAPGGLPYEMAIS